MNQQHKCSTIAWIWDFAGKFRPKYVLGVVSAVCGVVCGILSYFVMATIIGDLLGGCRDGSVYLKNCLIMAALWVGRCAFHSISTTLSHKATFAVSRSEKARWFFCARNTVVCRCCGYHGRDRNANIRRYI